MHFQPSQSGETLADILNDDTKNNMKNQILIVLFLLYSTFSFSQKKLTIDYFEENTKMNLFAFVGEKISIDEFNPNAVQEEKEEIDTITGEKFIRKSFIMDNAFRLKYKVLKNLYNDLKIDTVEFVAYDHYGKPSFAEYEKVILYISKSQNNEYYVHQKYEYNEIYITKDKEWIGLLNFGNVSRIEEGRKLNLIKVKLDKVANIDIKDYPKETIKLFYPEPFYKIEKNKAIPILGMSIKNLIKYKVERIIDENKHLNK